jgi:hypothetical protein
MPPDGAVRITAPMRAEASGLPCVKKPPRRTACVFAADNSIVSSPCVAVMSIEFAFLVFTVAFDLDVFDLIGVSTVVATILLGSGHLTTTLHVRALVLATDVIDFCHDPPQLPFIKTRVSIACV